jgi:lipopolysaccharide export LptBFGC system permease protein LptF
MLDRLDRYVLRSFASSYAVALLFIVGLMLVSTSLGQLDDFLQSQEELAQRGEDGGFLLQLLFYFLLQIPLIFLGMGPFVTFFAGLFTALSLRRSHELAPVLGAGRSLQRLLMPALLGGLLACGAMIALRESLLEPLLAAKDRVEARVTRGIADYHLEKRWFRDQPDLFVGFERFDPVAREIEGLTVSRHDEKGKELTLFAPLARFETTSGSRGVWRLLGMPPDEANLEGVPVRIHQKLEPGEESLPVPELIGGDLPEGVARLWRVRFRPDDLVALDRLAQDPVALSMGQVRRLRTFYPEDPRLETLALYGTSFPLAGLALLLLGLPGCVRLERGGSDGVFGALLACIAFFVADLICRDFGTQRVLHAMVACFGPLAFFGSLGCARYAAMRT